ncbi:OmpA family protein [Scandinavium sp. NPDC088450]|uniref:OmpA family protein n=1 Tax=Scandinavium sp. NPDC088450 TaxID=3364514 RepID=UPI00385110A8
MFTLSKKLQLLVLATACGLTMGATAAVAAPNDVLKTTYQRVADVGNDQAQVVYFRPANTGSETKNTNIYVDGEFQTALVPGSYTAFCVKPGAHALGAWLGDDPLYRGKQDKQHPVTLEGGNTYYVEATESALSTLNLLQENQASEKLAQTKLQNILLSRASAVVPCHYLYKEYDLSSDVLFNFGQYNERSIKQGGRDDVAKIAHELNQNVAKIVVIGHTDPIGSAQKNLTLGLNRAETVRQLLIEDGVHAENISAMTAGSKQPVATGCEGLAKSAKIACYAPDRRVVIRSYQE